MVRVNGHFQIVSALPLCQRGKSTKKFRQNKNVRKGGGVGVFESFPYSKGNISFALDIPLPKACSLSSPQVNPKLSGIATIGLKDLIVIEIKCNSRYQNSPQNSQGT